MKFHNNNKDTISAAMMVKNEEEMLPGCLDSIKNVVDEIIVVDTGSTDNTVQIAESYGAKVYHHPWENDFSKHRNQSISYATGGWILIIDADERLVSENISTEKLKKKLSEQPEEVHGVLITANDYTKNGKELKLKWQSLRIFRNNVGLHYDGSVHNQPKIKGKSIPSNLAINHFGYDLTKEEMKKKFQRTESLLQERIQKNPEDFEAYYYLTAMYYEDERLEQGIEYGQKCIKYMKKLGQRKESYLKVYYYIGAYLLKLEKYAESKKWLLNGIEELPEDIDFHYMLSVLGVNTRDFDLIIEHAVKYLEIYDKWSRNFSLSGTRIISNFTENARDQILGYYLSGLIAKEDILSLEQEIDEYRIDLHRNSKIVQLVLKNLSSMQLDEELIKFTGEFAIELKDNPELFDPLIEKLMKEQINESRFHNFVDNLVFKTGDVILFSKLLNRLINNELDEVAEYLLGKAEHGNFPYEIIAVKRALLNKEYDNEQVIDYLIRSVNENLEDKEFYLLVTPFLFKQGKFNHLNLALNEIVESYDSLNEVPEIAMLLLALTSLRNNQPEHFLNVTNELCVNISYSGKTTINDWSDLIELYDNLSVRYLEEDRTYMAELCLHVSYGITENGEYLKKIGDMYYEKGQYDLALPKYRDALDNQIFSEPMIKRMQKIFREMDNFEGVQQCDELLREYRQAV